MFRAKITLKKDKFYNTAAWRRLRAQKLATDPLCEYCPPGTVTAAVEVDHRTAINAGGGAFDWENLASSCHKCHSRKTLYIERMDKDRVPIKGCDVKGHPLDPEHWWRKGANHGT